MMIPKSGQPCQPGNPATISSPLPKKPGSDLQPVYTQNLSSLVQSDTAIQIPTDPPVASDPPAPDLKHLCPVALYQFSKSEFEQVDQAFGLLDGLHVSCLLP